MSIRGLRGMVVLDERAAYMTKRARWGTRNFLTCCIASSWKMHNYYSDSDAMVTKFSSWFCCSSITICCKF
jgi:uncharacterized membrane protein YhdT